MARSLTRRSQQGKRYTRPSAVEAALDVALNQDVEVVLHRAQVREPRSPEYLPSECLVHLIRVGIEEENAQVINGLVPCLLERCDAVMKAKKEEMISADMREEILGDFAELLAGTTKGVEYDKLDFFEIRFNKAFFTFRRDRLKKMRRQRDTPVREIPNPKDDENVLDEDILNTLATSLRSPSTVAEPAVYRELIDAINRLPKDEREAVTLCHVLGYEVESVDPSEVTAATRCGVSGRTIRNRLRRARERLAIHKEPTQ